MVGQGVAIVAFANVVLDDRNWREAVAAASVERHVDLPTPTTGPIVGIESADDAIQIQRELRHVLHLVVDAADEATFGKRAAVAQMLNARGTLRITYAACVDANRLQQIWETKRSGFDELLYAKLATSLVNDGFGAYARCPACGRFIFRRTGHAQRHCNDRCRALAAFRRQRQRDAGT